MDTLPNSEDPDVNVNEDDQKLQPITDQLMAPRGRDTEHG